GRSVVVDGAGERRRRVLYLDHDRWRVVGRVGSWPHLSNEQFAAARQPELHMFPVWRLNMFDETEHARAPGNYGTRIRNHEDWDDARVRRRSVRQHRPSLAPEARNRFLDFDRIGTDQLHS